MPYLGRPVTNAGQFEIIDDISSSFNGSNTSFTLQVGGTDIQPDSANVTIVLDGVVQIPTTAYSITGSTLNFSEAPANGTGFHGVLAGQSQFIESGFITNTHISDSANISGSKINTDFSAQTVQAKIFSGMISGSAQIATDISGSLGSNAAIIRTLDRTTISGSIPQALATNSSPTFAAGTITGDLSVGGTLTAQEVHTEFESASILFTSGSTIFGNSSDDIHNMTGSLNVSGGINLNDGTLTVTDNVDFNGDLDVDGTTNLDNTDIDGTLTVDGGNIVFNEDSANQDFRVESNGQTHMLFVDGDDKIGIAESSPSTTLHITRPGGSYTAANLTEATTGAAFLRIVPDGTNANSLFASSVNNYRVALQVSGSVDNDLMLQPFSGKVGIGTDRFPYTDYALFHIKGRGSDDSNVTGMTFHVGGTNANSRNWSITTNNSAHGSMDFRVSNANNNTPNTNLVMTMERDSTIVHKGATQFEGNTTVTADPGKLGVGAAVNSNVGSSMDVIQVGFTSQWYAEKTDSADRNVYIGNNFYHNGSYHRAIYEDQVCGIQFRAGDIKFRTTGSVPTSTNLEAGGGRARMVVHDDGRVSVGYDQTGEHDLEHDSALVVSSSGASGPLTRNAITAVGFCGAGSFNFGQSTVTFDNIKGDGPCFTLRNLGSSHTDRGPFQVYNGSTRILETRNDGLISGNFNDTSDRDFKQNINSITSSLKEVNDLRPVTFVWKQDEENGQNRGHGQTNIGFIAQEVSESIPRLVSGVSGSSSGLGINTIGVTAVLTKAIQELTQAHKDLRAMITGSSDLGQLKALVSGSSFV